MGRGCPAAQLPPVISAADFHPHYPGFPRDEHIVSDVPKRALSGPFPYRAYRRSSETLMQKFSAYHGGIVLCA
jgi:hypothetical protein